ncbi:MAG: tRNA (adenosine(37)-N6)-threonylcarbamoyltransferase complex ATPase subunit type 1 TsaE [Anaerolineales bacterium]|nr:tRNA (adenosine(37)-N6)-threonylcarbamoyltransferase complex ATPase subunit type 1 TsaE [Anaerolineales bacterium]MCK6581660.1 tRNA (adenosine(37)-N6)-threonylcarbamoyltransferase complex ATPase subunit type 1 TsaE [Anaerolineales bacterium]
MATGRYNFNPMPILDAHMLEFFSRSPEQTRRIGIRLGGLLEPGDVICLQGDLGAGKTTFAQGLAQGWGSLDAVSSPTFILVNQYRRADGGKLFHLDAYRLDSVPEAEELDLDSMLNEGALIIEWPERLGNLIPNDHLRIQLEHISEEHRRLGFRAHGKHYDELLDEIRQSVVGG